MKDEAFWFFRNSSALLLWIIVAPIFYPLMFIEDVAQGIGALFDGGSSTICWPWENWPFYTRLAEEDEE